MKKLIPFLVTLLFCLTQSVKSQPINFVWAKDMGGKGSTDSQVGLARDTSGNLYITGEFIGTRTFGSFTLIAQGSSDVFVAKYSSAGTCLWAVSGGSPFSSAQGGKLAVIGNELFVTGSFLGTIDFNGVLVGNIGSTDIFVAGFDASNGTCNWVNVAGSSFTDQPYGIDLAAGGGFYLCGTFTGNATFGSQSVSSNSMFDFDAFYAKYTSTGVCTWVNRIGSTGYDKANAIKQLPSGDLILTGSFEGAVNFGPGNTRTSYGYADIFVAKLNAAGVLTWATSGGSDTNNDAGFGISYDAADNIYVAGFIGDTSVFGSLVLNSPGGVNSIVLKFSPTGVCNWGAIGGGNNADQSNAIVTDGGGSSYVTGSITGVVYFGTTQLVGNGTDIFVVKYNNAGVLRWITRVGTGNNNSGKAIILQGNGFCYVAGDFNDNIVFGASGVSSPPGVTGMFLTRLGGGTVGIDELENHNVAVYPNPASDYIYLNFLTITDDVFMLSLYSIDGKEIISRQLNRQDAVANYQLNVQGLAHGNYVLKLETSKGDYSSQVVIGN